MRVLVVEDEQKVANALREGLEGERYDVAVERTGEDGSRSGRFPGVLLGHHGGIAQPRRLRLLGAQLGGPP